MYRYCVIVISVLSFLSCNRPVKSDCSDLVESISTAGSISAGAYEQALDMGKNAIPCLIGHIDVPHTSYLGDFKNPISSYIEPFLFNQSGIRYAYLVEFLLCKTQIEVSGSKEWSDSVQPYRLYDYGIIIKKEVGNAQLPNPLLREDMIVIRKIYSEWWDLNKDRPLDMLRAEYRSGNHPLKESGYMWI